MFGNVFPIAFLIAYFTNAIERYSTMYSLLKQSRRPIPWGAKDIGSWERMCDIISYVGIFVNAGLMAFTYHTFEDDCEEHKDFLCTNDIKRLITFYAAAAIGMVVKIIASLYFSSTPDNYIDLIIRQSNRSKVISADNKLPQLSRAGFHMMIPKNLQNQLNKNKFDAQKSEFIGYDHNLEIKNKNEISMNNASVGNKKASKLLKKNTLMASKNTSNIDPKKLGMQNYSLLPEEKNQKILKSDGISSQIINDKDINIETKKLNSNWNKPNKQEFDTVN